MIQVENISIDEAKQEVTVSAVIEDVVLTYAGSHYDPPEYGPALCTTTFSADCVDVNNEKELQEASRLDHKNEAILKRVQNAIQRLCKDGRKLTASNIANSTFSAREKQFRKAEYFLSRLETEALAREWLTKDSKDNYDAGKGLYK